MSLLFQKRDFVGATASQLIPNRSGSSSMPQVNADTAMRSSAVWACLRLRANLISTMPVDVFRRVNGVQVEVQKPPLLVNPGGSQVHITEWLYSTQVDLDRCGNTFGIISERDGAGFPRRIDLVPAGDVTVKGSGSTITEYRIGRTPYDPRDIWHEKQYTLAGVPLGLSPVAYGAYSIGGYLSAQQFALDWFTNSAGPGGMLRNTNPNQSITAEVADVIKRRFKESTKNRDIAVMSSDWEWTPGQADASQSAFIEQMQYGATDISRFFDVPADMIDAQTSTSSITYANVTQRNLQLLVMNVGPAIVRREAALSAALPAPRYVKFNTDAILRMDPAAVTANLVALTGAGLFTVDEGREVLNLPPLPPSAPPTPPQNGTAA